MLRLTHPMTHTMGDVFSDLLAKAQEASQIALKAGAADLLSKAMQIPEIQEGLAVKAEQTAVETASQQYYAAKNKIIDFYNAHKALVIGGSIAAVMLTGFGVLYIIRNLGRR